MTSKDIIAELGVSDEARKMLGERLELLIGYGKTVQATSPNVDISQRPAYFDEDRFQKAQKSCLKYYTNLSVASSTGLMLLLQIESVVVPLIRTGKSRTVPDLYDRYVATARYIRNCYETKFYETDTLGWKNISLVRAMHKRIYEIMNKDGGAMREGKEIWINQYDMSLTQFAFVGLFLTNPTKCAAYNVSKEELADVVYFWRLLSYYFGIEEQFNLFVFDHDIDLQLEYMRMVLDHINQLLKSSRVPVGTKMAEGFMLAFEDFTTESSFNILDHWWSPYISLSGLDQPKPYSLSDRWKLIFFNLYFNVLFRNNFLLAFMNQVYKRKFDRFEAAAAVVKPKLARKYKDLVFE